MRNLILALVVVLAGASACSAKAGEGEACAKPEDCGQGLTCAPDPKGDMFDPTNLRCLSPATLKKAMDEMSGADAAPKQESDAAKARRARQELDSYKMAVAMFQIDVGRCPTTEEGLNALQARPDTAERWGGPYLREAVSADPWGRAYVYRSPGENGAKFEILCLGADGAPGGAGPAADMRVGG